MKEWLSKLMPEDPILSRLMDVLHYRSERTIIYLRGDVMKQRSSDLMMFQHSPYPKIGQTKAIEIRIPTSMSHSM
jgi:hypothetical protein